MIAVTTFYQFHSFAQETLSRLCDELYQLAERHQVYGLVLVGTEGINATVCMPEAELDAFKAELRNLLGLPELRFKDSQSDKRVFRQFKAKIREEIVTLGRPDLIPAGHKDAHMSAEEWHQWLQSEDVVVIDTRNQYEVEIGKFKGAIDFNISNFQEFPERLKSAEIPKDKKVLIYCTGGIRCEKALLEMREQGYQNVHQLDGGILSYLKQFPNGLWEGECFVFDHRVAVDSELKPSQKFKLCPHCGQPAADLIDCRHCGTEGTVCHHCLEKDEHFRTCSKNCAHHSRHGHQYRRPHLDALKKKGRIFKATVES